MRECVIYHIASVERGNILLSFGIPTPEFPETLNDSECLWILLSLVFKQSKFSTMRRPCWINYFWTLVWHTDGATVYD